MFQDYLQAKGLKPQNIADRNGRAMFAISKFPQDQQPAAFADPKAHPDVYGVLAEHLPDQWSDTYGALMVNMGMTVSQAMTRQQAAAAEANRERHRLTADADRAARTGISRDRAAAAATQGTQRVGIAQKALGQRVSGGKAKPPSISSMPTSDLLDIVFGP